MKKEWGVTAESLQTLNRVTVKRRCRGATVQGEKRYEVMDTVGSVRLEAFSTAIFRLLPDAITSEVVVLFFVAVLLLAAFIWIIGKVFFHR